MVEKLDETEILLTAKCRVSWGAPTILAVVKRGIGKLAAFGDCGFTSEIIGIPLGRIVVQYDPAEFLKGLLDFMLQE